MEPLSPETTLFVCLQNILQPEETMMNAGVAKQWLWQTAQNHQVAQHFVAVSTECSCRWNIRHPKDNMFQFREWVGGRYSLWSAIGLSIVLAIGFETSKPCSMERVQWMNTPKHPIKQNIPVLMGVLGVWIPELLQLSHIWFCPTINRLGKSQNSLQQMDMESNGKVYRPVNGHHVDYATGPIILETRNRQPTFFHAMGSSIPDARPCWFYLCSKNRHINWNKTIHP